MVRLLELDSHVTDAYVDLVDLEEASAVGLVSGGELELEAETFATKEDIGDAGVDEGRESLLLLDIITDIYEGGQQIVQVKIKTKKWELASKITLNSGSGNHGTVLITIGNRLASESEVVVVSNLQEIGHQVV